MKNVKIRRKGGKGGGNKKGRELGRREIKEKWRGNINPERKEE